MHHVAENGARSRVSTWIEIKFTRPPLVPLRARATAQRETAVENIGLVSGARSGPVNLALLCLHVPLGSDTEGLLEDFCTGGWYPHGYNHAAR